VVEQKRDELAQLLEVSNQRSLGRVRPEKCGLRSVRAGGGLM
jgi:hypothetical protein